MIDIRNIRDTMATDSAIRRTFETSWQWSTRAIAPYRNLESRGNVAGCMRTGRLPRHTLRAPCLHSYVNILGEDLSIARYRSPTIEPCATRCYEESRDAAIKFTPEWKVRVLWSRPGGWAPPEPSCSSVSFSDFKRQSGREAIFIQVMRSHLD